MTAIGTRPDRRIRTARPTAALLVNCAQIVQFGRFWVEASRLSLNVVAPARRPTIPPFGPGRANQCDVPATKCGRTGIEAVALRATAPESDVWPVVAPIATRRAVLRQVERTPGGLRVVPSEGFEACFANLLQGPRDQKNQDTCDRARHIERRGRWNAILPQQGENGKKCTYSQLET